MTPTFPRFEVSGLAGAVHSAAYKAAPQRGSYADTGLTVAHPVPHIANWPAVAKAYLTSIESVWFQNNSVDKALKQGDSDINSALGQ
jgi:multiple sugar transport system substrate-binding protein